VPDQTPKALWRTLDALRGIWHGARPFALGCSPNTPDDLVSHPRSDKPPWAPPGTMPVQPANRQPQHQGPTAPYPGGRRHAPEYPVDRTYKAARRDLDSSSAAPGWVWEPRGVLLRLRRVKRRQLWHSLAKITEVYGGVVGMGLPFVHVGRIPFVVSSLDESVESAIQNAIASRGQNLRFANAYCVGLAETDPIYRQVLTSSGQNHPDGMPVAWMIKKRTGRKEPTSSFRVRGPSFFERVLDLSQGKGIRHTFVGATAETLELLVAKLSTEFPDAIIAGKYAPPFGEVNESFIGGINDHIRDCNPHFVWLGLGTPKQDFVAKLLSDTHPTVTFASVGAAFDFKSGQLREAPPWVQRAGFEWLYRFASEPKRLWRRYTLGNLHFARAVLRD
jgi:N-acetylglucosaminyldiphosphoundecaprenol N-acetyl-beta-D-mannosaminyltransferase